MAGSGAVLWALLSCLSCIGSAEDVVKMERIQVQLPISTYTSLVAQPIFYHTFIPILYKFSLPSVSTYSSIYSALCEKDDEEMSSPVLSEVSIMSSSNCSTDDGESTPPTTPRPPKSEESVACSTLKHLSQVFDEITHQPWKPVQLNPNPRHSPLSLVPCDEVSAHFESFKLSSKEFSIYVSRLKECNFGENVIMIPEPTVDERTDVQQLFMSPPNSSSATSHYERSGEAFNLVVAMQQASISHLQLERSKWLEAFSDCRSHLIPTTLIDYSSLRKALEFLAPKNFKLAVKNLHGYFNLPLSDCVVLEEETSLLVRVLIPVVKFNHNIHLVKATSIPAVKLVRDDLVELCDSLSGDLLLSGDDVILHKTCRSKELCRLDGSERQEWISKHCLLASKTLPASESQGNCTTQCYRLPTDHLPLIRRSNSNTFLATGTTPNTSVEISCNSDPSSVFIDLTEKSTAELVLPCECEIRTGTILLQRSVSPCEQDGSIRVIHYYLEEESSLSSTRPKGKNYSHGEIHRVQDQMTKFMYTLKSLQNDDDTLVQDLEQQVYYLWAIVVALTSSVILGIIILLCFSWRIKRMRRDFIKSNDHRSTFYSFTDMAVV